MEMSTFKMVSLNHIIEKVKQEQISNEYRVSGEQVSNGYRVSEKLGKVLQSFSFVTIFQAPIGTLCNRTLGFLRVPSSSLGFLPVP